MPKHVGNCVEINGSYIPAVNIQVEGVPGYITHTDNTEVWYGVYFEILFEDGSLWVVEQGFDREKLDEITVQEYLKFAIVKSLDLPGVKRTMNTWEEFGNLYLEKRQATSQSFRSRTGRG